jgi:hypothetical protein
MTMNGDTNGLRIKVKWKLEKFDGEKRPDSLPVEVLEGEDELTPQQLKEIQDGFDKRRA